jgi:hypothetical protein
MAGPAQPQFDGPGAIAALTAWLHDDADTVAEIFAESSADPAPMLFGLGFVATAAVNAYAEAAGLTVDEVLVLLGTMTARRTHGTG